MSAVPDDYFTAVRHYGTGIIVLKSNPRKRAECIDRCNGMSRLLYSVKLVGNLASYLNEDLVFKLYYSFLSAEHLCFQILQLARYKPLAVCKRLFSYVFLGDKLLERIRHFNVISKNSVVTDFELLYTCFFLLRLLNCGNIALAVMNNVSQLVQLRIEAVLYHIALTHGKRRLFPDRRIYKLGNIRKKINAGVRFPQKGGAALGYSAFDVGQKSDRC